MAFRLVIKPIVFADADEAVVYYEKNNGFRKTFYNSFLSTLTKIQSNPSTYSYIKNPVRRCKVEKFPYKIFYTIENNTILVIGISHAKRSNAFVKRRLRLLE